MHNAEQEDRRKPRQQEDTEERPRDERSGDGEPDLLPDARRLKAEGLGLELGATENVGGPEQQEADGSAPRGLGVFGEIADADGRIVQRSLDDSWNIIETRLDNSGEILEESIKANLADLSVVEEYVDDRGRVMSRARDESGTVFERVLNDEGDTVDVNAIEER